MTALTTIAIEEIEVGQRLRDLSEAQVEALMSSIADVGLLNPIAVYACPVIRGGIAVDGYGLVAGAHRLEAFKRLGHFEITAHVVVLSDLERQIAECDENLCGTKLTPSEKAMFTKRRKDAYEALHPETKHGANQHTRSPQVEDSTPADRFTLDTAKKTGVSEQSVQRDAERGEKVVGEVINLIRSTALDTGTYLDKIKKLKPADQLAAAKRDLAQERERARGGMHRRFAPKPTDEPLTDAEAKEKWVAAGIAWWNRGSQEWRDDFLARIDTPVMDRTAA